MNPSGAPEYFGQLWEERAVECNGGYDPGYISQSGGHVRPKCDYFQSCKARLVLTKANTRPALIPPQSLLRPGWGGAPATAVAPYQHVPGRPGPQPLTIQQHQQQQQVAYHQAIQMHPIEMMPVSHRMPAYLSEPETRLEGESYWAPMGREIFRGMGKALGHSVAHFFDHIPFTRKG